MTQQKNLIMGKYKYTIFSIVLFLIIFILGSLAFIFSMREIRYANAGRELSQTVERETLRLKAEVNGEISLVLKMADSPLVQRYFQNPDDPDLEKFAFEELSRYGNIFLPKSIFWVNDVDRKFYFNDSYIYTVDPDDPANYWYYMTLNGTASFNFNINHNPFLNLTNFWINAPVFDSNRRPIGILGTGIDVFVFIDSVYQNYASDVPLFFFNNAGEITGARNMDLVTNKVSLESELGADSAIIRSMMADLKGKDIQYFNVSGGVVALGAIPEFDWYVCAILPVGLRETLKTSMTVLFATMMAVVAGIFIIFNLMHSNYELNRERNIYRDMSIIDVLTGIYNRRFLEENLVRIIKSLSRSEGKLSLLMLDIDFFKKYNDTYGHSMGDSCLKTVANTLSQSLLRAEDFIARYGGEEFVVVLPNTDEDGAHLIALRLLYTLRERNIPHEKSDIANIVTISIGGVTDTAGHSQKWEDYTTKADQALYMSKKNGRNMYTAYTC